MARIAKRSHIDRNDIAPPSHEEFESSKFQGRDARRSTRRSKTESRAAPSTDFLPPLFVLPFPVDTRGGRRKEGSEEGWTAIKYSGGHGGNILRRKSVG